MEAETEGKGDCSSDAQFQACPQVCVPLFARGRVSVCLRLVGSIVAHFPACNFRLTHAWADWRRLGLVTASVTRRATTKRMTMITRTVHQACRLVGTQSSSARQTGGCVSAITLLSCFGWRSRSRCCCILRATTSAMTSATMSCTTGTAWTAPSATTAAPRRRSCTTHRPRTWRARRTPTRRGTTQRSRTGR